MVAAIVNWFAVVFTGRTPDGLHRFLTAYVNYATHVHAYISVAANRYPGFVGDPGYQVDIEFDPPAEQSRLHAAFRLILAIPAMVLSAALAGIPGGTETTGRGEDYASYGLEAAGVLAVGALLVWFYALFRARAPEGVVRLEWYALHYAAQTWSYILLITDRYPTSDPYVTGVPRTPPPHPVTLREEDDSLERSRLTVFFRLPLAIPHLVWLTLWSIAMVFAAIVNWFATLIRGRSPDSLHRFGAAFTRYQAHVMAFLLLVANPFPGFTGQQGSYPVDVDVAPPETQRRWWTAFRIVLAIPAVILMSGIQTGTYVAALLNWFSALFTGRAQRGLRNLAAFGIRYEAQVTAFAFALLTDRYPYGGPPAGPVAEPVGEPEPEAGDETVAPDPGETSRLQEPPEPPPSWPDPLPRA